MSWKEIIKKCLNVASAPIRRNANFFVFMYLLGMISSIVTTPAKGTLYDNLFLELFVDLYVVCAVVAIFPKKVRWGLRAVLYLILCRRHLLLREFRLYAQPFYADAGGRDQQFGG